MHRRAVGRKMLRPYTYRTIHLPYSFSIINVNLKLQSLTYHGKDSANREKNFHACMKKLFRDAAYLIKR